MCGITGIFAEPNTAVPQSAIDAMTSRLIHRGPDTQAHRKLGEDNVWFGHTRLAILDLTPAGAQPMSSHCGRFDAILNGEIYNFNDIRLELDRIKPRHWRGHSDTEVLVEAIAEWGFLEAIERCEGMFALGVWDRKERHLLLTRDRFGEKPLYIAQHAGILLFASELAAIVHYPGFEGLPDNKAQELFLSLSYIPEPFTPYANVAKLPAGCFACIEKPDAVLNPQAYWDPVVVARSARSLGAEGKAATASDIQERLQLVVQNQMVADVPLGVFLSGGVDSSLIASLMQEQADQPINSFTIGFEDIDYDEAGSARAVAEHLGTNHTEMVLSWRDALDLIDSLPTVYSEPFADSSQLPSLLVAGLARKDVTVALTGDGGDEVFGGYNRHMFGWRQQPSISRIPRPIRNSLGNALGKIAQPANQRVIEKMNAILGARGLRLPSEKLAKLAAALGATDDVSLYTSLVRRDGGLVDSPHLKAFFDEQAMALDGDALSLSEWMMILDTKTYLSGDILHKVDRASMSRSLETRAPLLDHKLYELARAIPIRDHFGGCQTKALLREMLLQRVPGHLFSRPKAGFGVPIDDWLRGPLRDWMEALISEYCQANDHHAKAVKKAKSLFLEKKGHHHHLMWNIAMWQMWARQSQS